MKLEEIFRHIDKRISMLNRGVARELLERPSKDHWTRGAKKREITESIAGCWSQAIEARVFRLLGQRMKKDESTPGAETSGEQL
ncbi:MAG: hypothetical protein AAGI11_15085 [Pseudomonadota bacterium]